MLLRRNKIIIIIFILMQINDLNAQVVIPKKLRDELGIEPGDEVVVSLSESGVLIQSVHATESLRGMFAGSGMLKMLMDDRRKEAR